MAKRSRLFESLLIISLSISGLQFPAAAQEPGAETADPSKADALASEARSLLENIEKNRSEIGVLQQKRDQAQGERRVLLDRRLTRMGLELLGDIDALVENVVQQEQQGTDATESRASAEELVAIVAPVARGRIAELQAQISDLTRDRMTATGEPLIRLETKLVAHNEKLSTILQAALDNEQHMAALGLPSADEEAFLVEVLAERAATSAERIRLSLDQIAMLQSRLDSKPDDADIQTELSAVQTKRDGARANLEATITMMSRLELDTAEYNQLLIETSGQLSADILDTDVAFGLFTRWMTGITDWAVETGPRLFFQALVFLLILFVFRLLARLTRKVVGRAVSSSKLQFSQLMQKMFISISGNVVMIIGLLVALSQLGFALGPVLAGLGIMGFVVGFALQDTLGNFAAGMMVLIYRPYDVGDMIEASGVFGKVSAMSMVSTTILTIDNQTLVVPNGKIWGDVIKNVTAQTVRRVDLVFGISYSDDIPHAEKVLAQILEDLPMVLKDPEPIIKLHNLGDSSVDFVVRPWCRTDDYWDVYWDVTREVKMRFDKESISIPFPQRDIHHYDEKRIATAP